MDSLGLCRLCANQKDNLLCIYGDVGSSQCIEAKIKNCLNIELSDKQTLPKSICLECCTKLDAFAEFLDSSRNAQDALSLLYADKEIRAQSPVPVLLSNEMKQSINEHIEPDDCSEDLYPVTEQIQMSSQTEEKNQETVFVMENDSELKSESSDSCEMDAKIEWEEPTIWFCSDCSEEFSDVESLKAHHGNEHKQEPRYMCIHCSKMFFVHNSFINHVMSHRNKFDMEAMSWLCSDCSEEFTDVESLKLHHTDEHKQEPKYMCNHCSKLFLVLNAFISHIKRHKNNTKYSCDDCGKGFSNKKVLESHKLSHSDVRPYVCQECGKSFRQQSALYIHMRCHLPEDVKNKYPCDLCNKRFSTKPNLVTHKRIHTGVRNFTCDQCGKSFIQKGNLDAHLLTHSHDKPFSCEVCNKRFKTSMQLRKHHSVHTGAKPHQCDVCGRTFREKGTLREHHRIHTGAMPFTCEFCGKSFRFKGILTTHRRQHTGERPYSCVECQHHFTNWPNYNKHMKRRHGINTSRSTRAIDKPTDTPTEEPQIQTETQAIYTDIQQTEIYTTLPGQPLNGHNLPTYMAYNVYSLSHVPSIDATTLNILPRTNGDMNNSPGTMVNVLV